MFTHSSTYVETTWNSDPRLYIATQTQTVGTHRVRYTPTWKSSPGKVNASHIQLTGHESQIPTYLAWKCDMNKVANKKRRIPTTSWGWNEHPNCVQSGWNSILYLHSLLRESVIDVCQLFQIRWVITRGCSPWFCLRGTKEATISSSIPYIP